jgi:hypothetical protein
MWLVYRNVLGVSSTLSEDSPFAALYIIRFLFLSEEVIKVFFWYANLLLGFMVEFKDSF